MKIKSITAVITNSSNEIFITKVYPDPEIYHYNDDLGGNKFTQRKERLI